MERDGKNNTTRILCRGTTATTIGCIAFVFPVFVIIWAESSRKGNCFGRLSELGATFGTHCERKRMGEKEEKAGYQKKTRNQSSDGETYESNEKERTVPLSSQVSKHEFQPMGVHQHKWSKQNVNTHVKGVKATECLPTTLADVRLRSRCVQRLVSPKYGTKSSAQTRRLNVRSQGACPRAKCVSRTCSRVALQIPYCIPATHIRKAALRYVSEGVLKAMTAHQLCAR